MTALTSDLGKLLLTWRRQLDSPKPLYQKNSTIVLNSNDVNQAITYCTALGLELEEYRRWKEENELKVAGYKIGYQDAQHGAAERPEDNVLYQSGEQAGYKTGYQAGRQDERVRVFTLLRTWRDACGVVVELTGADVETLRTVHSTVCVLIDRLWTTTDQDKNDG